MGQHTTGNERSQAPQGDTVPTKFTYLSTHPLMREVNHFDTEDTLQGMLLLFFRVAKTHRFTVNTFFHRALTAAIPTSHLESRPASVDLFFKFHSIATFVYTVRINLERMKLIAPCTSSFWLYSQILLLCPYNPPAPLVALSALGRH